MEKVKLQKINQSVGVLGLGAGPFGAIYGATDIAQCGMTVKNALDAGVNYIDTAPWYGQGDSEEMLGRFLPNYDRDSFVIATKVGRYSKKTQAMFDFSAARTVQSVNKSLNLLGLDYVDIIQVHDVEFAPSLDIILNETLPALEKIKKQGKAKMIGITGYPMEPLDEIIQRSTVPIDMVLCYTRGSLADQKLNSYSSKWKEMGIFVVNASPLAMGLFTSDGPQPWHPANDDLKTEVRNCIELCKEREQDISRLALRYSLDHINADIVLCGTARVPELESNIKNTITPLTDEERKTQMEVFERLKNIDGHWEGRELTAYKNRINNIEDDLPFFRN